MAQQTRTLAQGQQGTPKQLVNYSLMQVIRWNIADSIVMTRRNLTYYVRQPQLLVVATIQPVMFLLLFTFVFGGAISLGAAGNGEGGGQSYIQYLLPGILVQTTIFAATQTTTGLVSDLSKGLIDRFRSLPMGRAAVLAGRTLADALRGLFTMTIMLMVGALVGFRFGTDFLTGVSGLLIAVAFGYAMTWVSALIALFVQDPETAQVAGFIWVFPLVFASSIFVPVETMPTWLRIFAENQPISRIANAVRGLMVSGVNPADIGWAVLWISIITGVFMPLAVWQYGKATAE
jgi:ABC transporter DrrB family efflux protein